MKHAKHVLPGNFLAMILIACFKVIIFSIISIIISILIIAILIIIIIVQDHKMISFGGVFGPSIIL